ncbi:MAG: hypothetical protein KUL86_14230 [Castellaniella sp.]|nr:hypothetical protein [Castellaniella sp.]
MKRIIFCLLFIPTVSFGGWFGDSKPPDALTLKAATESAQQDVVLGTETRAFKRDNGWVDPNSANRYLVRYAYEIALTDDMPQVVLNLAKDTEAQLQEIKKNPGFMGVDSLNATLSISNAASNWINGQEKPMDRVNTFLSNCAECIAYWNNDGGEEEATTRHRNVFMASWSTLESMGFKDNMKKGDGVPWHSTISFMKTENGWERN